jgi:FAD/FMN-containing dehydrogenase
MARSQTRASCDNLLAVEVITADGGIARADSNQNSDLFWAVRGGGGNFGIVTDFSYRLHPITQAWGGMRAYPLSQGRAVLRFFREFTSAAPDELSTQAGIVPLAGGPAFGIMICYAGDIAVGEKVLGPLRSFGKPLSDSIRPMRFLEVQTGQADVPALEQVCFHQKSGFLHELSDDAIDVIAGTLLEAPSPLCGSTLWHHHGAVCRVATHETAFGLREAGYYFWTQTFWQDPSASASSVEWVNRCWNSLRAFFSPWLYVNQLGNEGDERVRAAYGSNYERLVALKNKYDPTNFFRLNQNINPTE